MPILLGIDTEMWWWRGVCDGGGVWVQLNGITLIFPSKFWGFSSWHQVDISLSF